MAEQRITSEMLKAASDKVNAAEATLTAATDATNRTDLTPDQLLQAQQNWGVAGRAYRVAVRELNELNKQFNEQFGQ